MKTLSPNPAPRERSHGTRRVLGAFRLALLAFVASLMGCFVIPRDSNPLEFPPIAVGEITYSTVEVKRHDLIQSVVTYGVFVPSTSRELYYKYRGGQITDVYVKAGDQVRKGDVLATLSAVGLKPQIELQEIAIEKAKLRLEMLRVTQANKFELRMAELDVRAAEVQHGALQEQLDLAQLVAPFSGVVTKVNVEEGDTVEAFATALEVMDPGELILECSDVQGRRYLVVGMQVDVEANGAHYLATVTDAPSLYQDTRDQTDSITQNPQRKAKTPAVRLHVAGLPATVKANDLGRMEIVLQKRTNAIAIPKDAVHLFSQRTYVYVLEQGVKRERDVQLGLETPTEVEILKGISEGDLVVTSR